MAEVPASANQCKGFAFTFVQRKAGLARAQQMGVFRQGRKAVIPRCKGIMIARYKVHGNARIVEPFQTRYKQRKIGIRRARIVEDVARNHHKIDLLFYGGVDNAPIRIWDCLQQHVGPQGRACAEPLERRPQMQVGCMYERNRAQPSLPLVRLVTRIVEMIGELGEFRDECKRNIALTNLNPDGSLGEHFWTPMFPILFITIACGACSGFHALVSSGTSSKQLAKETDATAIGYGAMLLEGMVAVVSIVCVMILAKDSELITKAPNFIYAMGIGSFMELIGIPAAFGISFGLMAFTTFVYDTLDVCTRLGRYVIEELTGWRDMKGKVLGTVLTSAVPIFFIFQTMTDAKGNVIPAWKTFWNTFGASNQLLAALALIGISIWLYNTRRNSKVWMAACIPAVLMFLMSNWALLLSIYEGWVLGLGHPAVPVVSVILVILSVLVAVETIYSVSKSKAQIQKEQ